MRAQPSGRRPECSAKQNKKKQRNESHCLSLFLFFFLSFCLCVCVCVCVLPAGLKSQHQTSTSQSLRAGGRRLCQDVQHQKVSPMPRFIYSHSLMRGNKMGKKRRGLCESGSNDNVWHFWSAKFRVRPHTWKDIYEKKKKKRWGWVSKSRHWKNKNKTVTQNSPKINFYDLFKSVGVWNWSQGTNINI